MSSTTPTQKLSNKKHSIMGLSKYMTPPQFKHTTAPRPAIDFAPHLVPKDKTRKITSKTATKPTDRTILLAKSDSPAIPDVVLEHAAPCETGMKVEDRLFDRCGSVFVLRKSKSSSQCRTSSRSATGRLEPPSHLKAAEVHGEPSNAQLGASKNTVREVGDQDVEMDLDATSQSDYCTYMAGLYSDD